jgi:hypothetical protein
MLRHGFTLWFALTALLGPGVCYRALAASVARPGGATAPAGREPDAARLAADSDHAVTGDSHPPECPSGQGKKAQALPRAAYPDAVAELRLPVGTASLPPSLLLPVPSDDNPVGPDAAHLLPPLAGRDLLAAYSLLRC